MSGFESDTNTNEKHKDLSSDESFEMVQEWKERIDDILYRELTVDNIETFADNAADDLVDLNDEILKASKEENSGEISAEFEDKIYESLGLPPVGEILERIGEVGSRIEDLKEHLQQTTDQTGEVLIPPQEDKYVIKNGSGSGFEKKSLIPRLLTLSYILETDFDLGEEDIKITRGEVREEMVRKESYVRVEVDQLNRVVYLCDEEGNASYVFDTKLLDEYKILIGDIDINDKSQLQSLIKTYPGIGKRIVQGKNWRYHVSQTLSGPISPEDVEIGNRQSEFIHKRGEAWPDFEDFQQEVRALYPGKVGVSTWYRKEKETHPNWPANPDRVYVEEGWEGWPELVGKKNLWKREYLAFEDFSETISKAYPGDTALWEWYRKEGKNHPEWPYHPEREYGDQWPGGLAEIVGMETVFDKEWLRFDDFAEEVIAVYLGADNVEEWYLKERENHPNWPASPSVIYKDNGWQGFPELVGKENRLKKEWPEFEELQEEVTSLYPGEGSISIWYLKERENHPNWPSRPPEVYKDKGWLGWPEFVGNENKTKIEWPNFEDFRQEVRALYPGKVGVSTWYRKEKETHPNWPANPDRVYVEEGWEGWLALVNKENRSHKEWPTLEDFRHEVSELYPGGVAITRWYNLEQKNHSNWPTSPDKIYKGKGWVSWGNLVGNE